MIVNMLSPSYADLLKLDHDWFYLSQTLENQRFGSFTPLVFAGRYTYSSTGNSGHPDGPQLRPQGIVLAASTFPDLCVLATDRSGPGRERSASWRSQSELPSQNPLFNNDHHLGTQSMHIFAGQIVKSLHYLIDILTFERSMASFHLLWP